MYANLHAKPNREEEPADGIPHGHVTSISVMRSHRRLGLAKKLMEQSREYREEMILEEGLKLTVISSYFSTETAMRDVYGGKFVSLHVRCTNRTAINLYRDTLGFTVHETEKGYCEYGRHAFVNRLPFLIEFFVAFLQMLTEKMHLGCV